MYSGWDLVVENFSSILAYFYSFKSFCITCTVVAVCRLVIVILTTSFNGLSWMWFSQSGIQFSYEAWKVISQDFYHYFLLKFIWSSYLIFVEVACNQTYSVCSVSREGKTMLAHFGVSYFILPSAHFRATHCWRHFWVSKGAGPSKEGERLAEEVAVWLHLVVTLPECLWI